MPRIEAGVYTRPTPSRQHRPRGPMLSIPDVECVRESDHAILCYHGDWDQPEWIPKSQISEDSELWQAGQTGKLIITEWIAIQKGFLDAATHKKPTGSIELAEPYKLYRQLIRKYHPDLNSAPWASEVAKDLTTLWREVLKAGGKR